MTKVATESVFSTTAVDEHEGLYVAAFYVLVAYINIEAD